MEARTLTLEEAIKHCDEVAETQEWMSGTYDDGSMGKKLCLECASEHRQLAEWLRELKAYREELPKEIKNVKVRQAYALEANVNNENYNSHLAEYIKGYLCGLSYTEGIIAKIIEEVNAESDKGVLDQINEKQDSLRATCKAWDEAISRDGYVD